MGPTRPDLRGDEAAPLAAAVVQEAVHALLQVHADQHAPRDGPGRLGARARDRRLTVSVGFNS